MIDREKVIKGLECCDGYCDDETGCPYSDELEPFDCQEQLRADALALLKVQEPTVDAVQVVHGHWIIYPDVCICSECNEQSSGIFKYCPTCGALMDMEAKEMWE